MLNEAEIPMDEARRLVSDRMLWPLVRDFLWDFAPQMHPSWSEGLKAECQKSDVQDVAASTFDFRRLTDAPRVKAWLLERLGVEPCFHAFPKNDWSRLLLLDGATLLEVAKWLGSLACADSLRRVTDGATVHALRAELTGVYPEVFSFTAYFKGLAPLNDVEARNPQGIVAAGCQMLFSVVHGVAEPLQQRFKLKLPKHLCELCLSAPPRETGAGTVRKLLRLKFPEAHKLCC